MPIINNWDNDDKTIIRMDVSGRWTWDELSQAMDESTIMVDSVNYIVYAVADISLSQSIPGNFITNARNLVKKRHPRSGMTVFVGASPLIMGLWRMFDRVYSMLMLERNFTFASTLDEARSILKHHLQSTPASEKVIH